MTNNIDEVIERLSEDVNICRKEREFRFASDIQSLINTVKEDKWVSVEAEPLPKDGDEFLAAYARCMFTKTLMRWDIVHKRWLSKGDVVLGVESNVTHWMPLPKRPKE